MEKGERSIKKAKMKAFGVYDLNFNVSFDQFVDLTSYSSIAQTSCPNSFGMCLATLIRASNWFPISQLIQYKFDKKHFTLWPVYEYV